MHIVPNPYLAISCTMHVLLFSVFVGKMPFNPFTHSVSEVNFSTLNCRRVHCVKKRCYTNPAKIEIEKENSVDPDEMAHMSHLIWNYTVCSDLFSGGLSQEIKILYMISSRNENCFFFQVLW